MAKPVSADLRPGHTGILGQQLGVKTHIPLGKHHGGAGGLGGLGIDMAIHGGAHNAHEQTARLHTTGVAGDGHDFGILLDKAQIDSGALQQIIEFHRFVILSHRVERQNAVGIGRSTIGTSVTVIIRIS